ncbi:hypothetical protein JHK87_006309 [Glycine soja]|nr:hypothetical protein JHK87_006309 [Glycine soja]
MEVRIKILFTTICHTDLTAWQGQGHQRVRFDALILGFSAMKLPGLGIGCASRDSSITKNASHPPNGVVPWSQNSRIKFWRHQREESIATFCKRMHEWSRGFGRGLGFGRGGGRGRGFSRDSSNDENSFPTSGAPYNQVSLEGNAWKSSERRGYGGPRGPYRGGGGRHGGFSNGETGEAKEGRPRRAFDRRSGIG